MRKAYFAGVQACVQKDMGKCSMKRTLCACRAQIVTDFRDNLSMVDPIKTTRSSAKPVLAAIDIGSNSFRLELATLSRDRYKRIDYLKSTVRLGGGLDAEGVLSEEAMLRGLACLRTFAQRLKQESNVQLRAVATQTLREASNRDEFLKRGGEVLGAPIEVISGREEARLIYQGVSRMQPSELPRLVIDIGGRSTEMILGRGRTSNLAESFGIGSVQLSMKHFANGEFTAEAFKAAQVEAGAELEEALIPFSHNNWREAMGASGTVGAVSDVLKSSGITDGRITQEALRWCIEQCIKAGHIDRLELPGLKADRKAVVGGGLSILYTLSNHFDVAMLLPAKGALRQGVIFDLAERLDAAKNHRLPDPRDATVRELQRRFQVDLGQAERVRQRALTLWDSWHADCTPSTPEFRRELSWACDLHEIGMMVSHHDHHRHSAYLLSHVDAAGFSQSQLRRLGSLVLGQRGDLSKLAEQVHQRTLMTQVLCLRLASLLHHSRMDLPPKLVKLQADHGQAICELPEKWGQKNLRTSHLLEEECERWQTGGDRPLVIHWRA